MRHANTPQDMMYDNHLTLEERQEKATQLWEGYMYMDESAERKAERADNDMPQLVQWLSTIPMEVFYNGNPRAMVFAYAVRNMEDTIAMERLQHGVRKDLVVLAQDVLTHSSEKDAKEMAGLVILDLGYTYAIERVSWGEKARQAAAYLQQTA